MKASTGWATKGSVVAAAILASTALLAGCSSSETAKQDYTDPLNNPAGNAVVGAALGMLVPVPMGFDDDISDCGQAGDKTVTTMTPVLVANTYNTPQTFSLTINPTLSGNAMWVPAGETTSNSTFVGCNIGKIKQGAQTTFDVAVPAGQTMIAGYLIAGAGETGTNNEGQDNNLSIGAGGTQWYDFWLHTKGLTFSFQNFELNYSNTGGTDPSQNLQTGLFNGIDCTSDGSSVTVNNPPTLTTPYGSNANAWTFNENQPICFAFLQPNTLS